MKNKLLWPQRLPPVSPCGHLCHRKTPRVRKLSNTCSDRAPGTASGDTRSNGTAETNTWADAKTEPHKQRKEIAARVLWSASIWEIPQQIYDLSQIYAQVSHEIARFS